LRIRRNLVAALLLALGLTGALLATLSGTAGSVPKTDTTVTTSTDSGDKNSRPDRMGYDVVRPDGTAGVAVP
jgi:ABC-type glycerol-3-phosphate transport system substrate-binding protein